MVVFKRSGKDVVKRETTFLRIFELIESDFLNDFWQLAGDPVNLVVELEGVLDPKPSQCHPVTGVGDRDEMYVHQVGLGREVHEVSETVDGHSHSWVPVGVLR